MTVNRDLQKKMKERIDNLFATYGGNSGLLMGELASLGFVQKGGNIAAKTLEHTNLELFLIIGYAQDGSIANYEIIPFAEMKLSRKEG
ncbi:MAG: hypothetical protein APR53_08480 [Methanoculleus sp. SDB]|nr:MAG: hypothetical protein APR53_08480 [Methanoculleus sp. SDB]